MDGYLIEEHLSKLHDGIRSSRLQSDSTKCVYGRSSLLKVIKDFVYKNEDNVYRNEYKIKGMWHLTCPRKQKSIMKGEEFHKEK